MDEQAIHIPVENVTLEGDLVRPEGATAIVVFAHGSGSSRFSPRNRLVAGVLQQSGLATLLMDLLTEQEERVDAVSGQLRFDIELLAKRLTGAADWLRASDVTGRLAIGYFGSSTGGGAALVAAAVRPSMVGAVVSRGGRPDLAGSALGRVTVPTLLIVGGDDEAVIEMNRAAMRHMHSETRLEIVPGATHLFEEPGTLERVAHLARDWFLMHLVAKPQANRQSAA